jgi:hypothetical protein
MVCLLYVYNTSQTSFRSVDVVSSSASDAGLSSPRVYTSDRPKLPYKITKWLSKYIVPTSGPLITTADLPSLPSQVTRPRGSFNFRFGRSSVGFNASKRTIVQVNTSSRSLLVQKKKDPNGVRCSKV